MSKPRQHSSTSLEGRDARPAMGDAEHFWLLLHSAGEGIYSIDRQGRCTFLNKAASEMLTLTQEQALGKDMHALIHHHRSGGEQFPAEECPIFMVGKTGHAHTEEDVFWRADGTSFAVRYTASPILKNGEIAGTVVSFTDISAQRRAELATEEADAKLRFALDAVGIGAWDLDLVDGSAWRSLRHDQIFGYPERLPEWTYEMFLEHIHPDDREHVDSAFRSAVAAGKDWSFEARIRRADGAPRWIWARGAHLMIEGEKPTRMIGTVMDITERKETERAFNEAKVRLESALNVGEIGTWIWNVQDDQIFADPNMARMFGLSPELADGGEIGQVVPSIHAEDRERVMGLVETSLRTGGPYEADYRVTDADGNLRWVVARGKPEFDSAGKAVSFPGVVIDITERKRAEEALRNQRHWLEQLLNLAPTPVLLIEPGTARVQFANRAAGEMAGGEFPRAQNEAEYSALYDCSDPNGNILPPERMPGVMLARGQRLDSYELRMQTSAGERTLLAHADTLPAMHGHPATGILVFQDISEIKRMTEELQLANRTKDEFLAIVSHELRTPLNAMLGWASILQMGTPEPDIYARAVSAIERNARAQAQIIEDILDTSRIVSGHLRLDVRPVDFGTVVRAAVDSAGPSAAAKDLRLHCELPPRATVVHGDTGRLQQVMDNLLSNAVKFSDPGGTVSVRLWQEGEWIRLAVQDSGQGIDPNFLPKVFDRFQQADSSSSRPTGGLGLGLAISRQLLELHGGTIQAYSAGRGRGATFTVTLPEAGAAPLAAAQTETEATGQTGARSAPDRSALAGLRVLAVDDVDDALQLIASVLDCYGAEVKLASSAEAALEALRQGRYDVVVSDIEMPGQDGYALIGKLRGLSSEAARLPAIALTAHAGPSSRERVLQAGYDAHVPKPFEPEFLIRRIVALTRTHSAVDNRPGPGN